MATWIDFKELRSKLRFEEVLRHYRVELKIKGRQHQGFCPLPSHQGKKNSPSFSANLEKGIWQCFGCGGKGNLIDFAARMERLDPENGADIRKAALLLQERFLAQATTPEKPETQPEPAAVTPTATPKQTKDTPKQIINAPLDFRLKNLDPDHPYLKNRGFIRETINHFGLGYCSRGMLAGRIAIPLEDALGRLIGYAGRLVDDKRIDRDNPKYRFPGEREYNGAVCAFQKHLFLYRGLNRETPSERVIVVEGFPAVWWLFQNGFPDTVALMGASASEEQIRLVIESIEPSGSLWIFTDGDNAGVRCAQELLRKISPLRLIRWVNLPERRQPTDCNPEELNRLLEKKAP